MGKITCDKAEYVPDKVVINETNFCSETNHFSYTSPLRKQSSSLEGSNDFDSDQKQYDHQANEDDESKFLFDSESGYISFKQKARPSKVILNVAEDSDNEVQEHCMTPLYCQDLNECVDYILENRVSHIDMVRQLEKIYGKSKKELEKKYIIRHKNKLQSQAETKPTSIS